MKRLGFIAILAAFFIAAVGYVWPPYTNRFRVTIEVDTPDGIRSGSSVIETTYFESGDWGPVEARGVRARAKGEAIFVDLGRGRNLVAILGWGKFGENEDQIFNLTRAALAASSRVDWKDESKLKGRGDLPLQYVPTLITFDDLSNPTTARLVDPTNFAATFGQGYSLHRVTLETTSASLTHSIEAKLPWWSSPGRPANVAWRAWRNGHDAGVSQYPEGFFRRD